MFLTIATLAAYAALAAAQAVPVPINDLTIEVRGRLKAADRLMVAVYADGDSWLRRPVRALRSDLAAEPARTQQHSVAMELPMGRYAVAVYVDRNANGKLDLGLFSIPSEPYGFSGGGGGFGPPSFDHAAFALATPAATVSIDLR